MIDFREHAYVPPLSGVPVIKTDHLAAGRVFVIENRLNRMVIVGTRPLTPIEEAREEGRRIVRHGLADVLAWLGEPVGPAPGDPPPTDLVSLLARAERPGTR